MRIKLHRNFEKDYKKLTSVQKKKFKERRDVFLKDELNPILNNHPLKGGFQGYRSINVTGDIRAIYRKEADLVVFVTIGSHSKLYG